jgi:hypothetical protein
MRTTKLTVRENLTMYACWLISTTKLTVGENLTAYACWLSLGRPTGKENHVKRNKKFFNIVF